MNAGRVALLASFVGLLLMAGWSWYGRDYYRLPQELRPKHPRHEELRPSGRVGIAFALVGTGLLLFNLTYLLRKRLLRAKWLGTLRGWMAVHVATGLLGAGFIAVHSAYVPRSAPGLLAISCLGVVVVTGLVGRYIHARVPRTMSGREMDRNELRGRLHEHGEQLLAAGFDLESLGPRGEVADKRRPVLASLVGIVIGDRELRQAYRRVRAGLRDKPELLPLARRYVRDEQRLGRYAEMRGLMASWRFMHRWLAIVMLAFAAVHIALALGYGDLVLPFGTTGGSR